MSICSVLKENSISSQPGRNTLQHLGPPSPQLHGGLLWVSSPRLLRHQELFHPPGNQPSASGVAVSRSADKETCPWRKLLPTGLPGAVWLLASCLWGCDTGPTAIVRAAGGVPRCCPLPCRCPSAPCPLPAAPPAPPQPVLAHLASGPLAPADLSFQF